MANGYQMIVWHPAELLFQSSQCTVAVLAKYLGNFNWQILIALEVHQTAPGSATIRSRANSAA